MRAIFSFVISILFWQLSWSQMAPTAKNIDPAKHFLSQIEIGIYYGLAYRYNKPDPDLHVASYYNNQAEGKELSFTSSIHLFKNLFLEYTHSRFLTKEQAVGLIIPIDDDLFFYLVSEEFQIIRNGLSFNYQKQLIKTSNARLHLGAGITRSKVNDAMTLNGNQGPFLIKLKSKAITTPFISFQVSTAILRNNIRVHAKYTQHFGQFKTLSTDSNDFELEYVDDYGNSLFQNTFQAGVSWIFNFKNPLKVKAP